jgi:hypothetical protein
MPNRCISCHVSSLGGECRELARHLIHPIVVGSSQNRQQRRFISASADGQLRIGVRVPAELEPAESAKAARVAGASIRGERIASRARSYRRKPDVRIAGKRFKQLTLEKNALCVVEVPLRARTDGTPPSATPVSATALHGERIDARPEDYSRIGKIKGSSTRNIQTCKLIGDAYCVLMIPLIGLASAKA